MRNQKELYTFLLYQGFVATDEEDTFIHAGGEIKAVLQVNNRPPAYVELFKRAGKDTRKHAPKNSYLWNYIGESQKIQRLKELLNKTQ